MRRLFNGFCHLERVYEDVPVTEVKQTKGGRAVEVDYDRSQTRVCVGLLMVKNTGLLILLTKKGWGIGILREYMYFPVVWDKRYAIRKIKTGMHGCEQLDACNWWEGGGG